MLHRLIETRTIVGFLFSHSEIATNARRIYRDSRGNRFIDYVFSKNKQKLFLHVIRKIRIANAIRLDGKQKVIVQKLNKGD